MISTIKVFNDAGDIVGQEVVSGDLILRSTVTEDGLYGYNFNVSAEVNRLVMVCPEEGELSYQVFESLGTITVDSGKVYNLDSGLEGKLSGGSELFIATSANATDIGSAIPVTGKSYMVNGAVVSDGKTAEIVSIDTTLNGEYAYNFYNGKTSKLIASLPLVSAYHSTATVNKINVKFKDLGDRKVDLYFIKEG